MGYGDGAFTGGDTEARISGGVKGCWVRSCGVPRSEESDKPGGDRLKALVEDA